MSDHARLSPSSAHRWMACAGSVLLEGTKTDTSSEFADEGTAAHSLAALCLSNNQDASAYLGANLKGGERLFKVDTDMAQAVQVYIDNIREYAASHDMLVEQRVNFSRFVGVDNQFGTADTIVLTADGNEIQVHDLKFGRGVRVDAEQNEQMMLYALGAYDQYSALSDFKHVRMVIHQPRLGHLSEWNCTIEELLAFGEKAKAAAVKADDIVTTGVWGLEDLNAGEKQCRFCKAKATCPKLAQVVQETVGADFENIETIKVAKHEILSVASGLDLLAPAMNAVELIEGWCKAVRAETERRLINGVPVEGWKLVQGRKGSRQWVDEKTAEETLKAMRIKHEDMYDYSVISPTTAEKLAKSEIIGPRQWPKLKEIITQKDGKPSVAHASDKREALVLRSADDFTVIGEGESLV